MNKLKTLLAVSLILFGIIFSFAETAYFGGHFFPKSGAEITCDFVGLVMVFAGLLLSGGIKIDFD